MVPTASVTNLTQTSTTQPGDLSNSAAESPDLGTAKLHMISTQLAHIAHTRT